MDPLNILVWTFIGVVIITVIITFLALIGFIRLGGGNGNQHNYYLKKLFQTLIIEVIVVAVGAFSVFLTNRNKEIAGLKDLVQKTNSSDSMHSISKDPVSISKKLDSMVEKEIPPLNNTNPKMVESKNNTTDTNSLVVKRIVRDTLSATIYVTTDNPTSDTKLVVIPANSRYIGHNAVVTTKNGDAIYNVELVTSSDTVQAVKLIASVGPRNLFGPRNWIGVVLQVYTERQIL